MKNNLKSNEKELKQNISESKLPELSEIKKNPTNINTSRAKKQSKMKESNLTLQSVMGISSNSHNNLALNPLSGEIAYPAGSMLVVYNPILNKQSKFIFSPNKKPFTCVTYSKDGKFLIAGEGVCKNPEINIWDLRHENPPVCLKGHKFGIEKILFSPNNNYLVSIGDENDKGLFVWDWEKEIKLTMNKLSKKINSATFNLTGTLLVTAGVQHLKFWPFDSEGKIILSKPKESENVYIIEGKSAILGAKFQNKTFMDVCALEEHIYALDSEGVFCVLNEQRKLEKWMDLKVSTAFTLQITSNHIICGCSEGIIRFFDTKTLHHITTLPKPPALGGYNIEKGSTKASVILSSPENYADVIALLMDEVRGKLTALYSDRTLFIWDIHDLEKVIVKRSFLNHNGTIYDIQTLENSSYEVTFFATGSIDQTIRIWNLLEDEKAMPNIPGLRKNLYSKNLTRILYLGDNFDHFKYKKEEAEAITDKQIRCLRCSHDGQYLAAGDLNGVLRIFSLITFAKIVDVVSHDQEILCMDFTPENPLDVFLLATGSRDRLIHIYNGGDDFKLLTTLEDHNSSISALQFAYHKAKNNILLMSCGVDKTLIFREYKAKEAKPFLQIHLEIDKMSKFFTMDLNHENNIAVLGQEKKLQLWSIDEMKFLKTIETKEEDKLTGKVLPLDNLKISVDSSGTYIAVSNNDKIVRIRDFNTGNLVAKVTCGDIITSLAFTQNSKYLITASSKGCIYIWKLSQEIKSTIEKKKQQLGLLAKRLKEMLGKSKDLTLDSFWIEEELKQFLKKEEPNSNINSSVNYLLDELSKNDVPISTTEENKKKMKLQQLNLKPRELFQKPEEIVLDFGNDPSHLIINQELPSWAQSNIQIIKEEINNSDIPFLANKIKQSIILKDKDIQGNDVLLNNMIPNWLESDLKKNNPEIKPILNDKLMETIFVEIDMEKEQNTPEQEEKDEEIYPKPEKDPTYIDETDPFIKKNYFDLDKLQISSPLRSSLTSQYLKEHSIKKTDTYSPFFKEKKKNEELDIKIDNEPFPDIKIEPFNKKQNDSIEKIEENLKNEPNKQVIHFTRNPKKEKKLSIFDMNEISEQMQMINKNIDQLQLNLGKNDNVKSLFDSQVEIHDLEAFEPKRNVVFEPKIINSQVMSIEKINLVERSIEHILNKDKSKNNEIKEIIDFNESQEEDINDISEEKLKNHEENDVVTLILNESKKNREKLKENNQNLLVPEENFHEMIVRTLSPVKDNIQNTEKEFQNSRNNSPNIRNKEKNNKKSNEFEKKIENYFQNFNINLENLSHDLDDFLIKESNNNLKEKIISMIDKKVEESKSKLENLINKKEKSENILKLFELENSNMIQNNEASQNKSISINFSNKNY